MNIKDLYKKVEQDEAAFLKATGKDKKAFGLLLQGFELNIPKELSKEERLFAILYANKNSIAAAALGEKLEYSKKNWSKYGNIFIGRATAALTKAEEATQNTKPPALPHTPEKKPLPLVKTPSRKKTEFKDNVTISLANEKAGLDPNLVIEHADRRVYLFFYLLIAYYNTRLTVSIGDTSLQHGIGTKTAHACHSAILPSVWDTEQAEEAHKYDTRNKPSAVISKTSILDGTHLQESLNSTIQLDGAVNYFETHYIEGKKTSGKMRTKSLGLVNEVSQGNQTPVEGLLNFVLMLKDHIAGCETAYLEHEELPTSPRNTRSLILAAEKEGSFGWLKEQTASEKPALKEEFIHAHLGLSKTELACLEPKANESKEDYESRLPRDRKNLYQTGYERIKAEISGGGKLLTRQGIFAQSDKTSSQSTSALLVPS